MREQWWAGPRPRPVSSAQWPKLAHSAQADGAACACPRCGHYARDAHGDACSGSSPMTPGRRDLRHKYEEVKGRAPGNSNEAGTLRDSMALVRRWTVVARRWFFHGGGAPAVFSGDGEVMEHRWMERSEVAATNRGKFECGGSHREGRLAASPWETPARRWWTRYKRGNGGAGRVA
jgi:hypothetical protein